MMEFLIKQLACISKFNFFEQFLTSQYKEYVIKSKIKKKIFLKKPIFEFTP
jgi:hypothetical protein